MKEVWINFHFQECAVGVISIFKTACRECLKQPFSQQLSGTYSPVFSHFIAEKISNLLSSFASVWHLDTCSRRAICCVKQLTTWNEVNQNSNERLLGKLIFTDNSSIQEVEVKIHVILIFFCVGALSCSSPVCSAPLVRWPRFCPFLSTFQHKNRKGRWFWSVPHSTHVWTSGSSWPRSWISALGRFVA